MAEVLAGLLTSAIAGIAKDKLASAIAEKASLLWNFDNDLEDMMAVLESFSAALQDAEQRFAKEKLVQLWLKRLKNAALNISDMLEDYQDTSRKKLTAKVPGVLSCLPIARKKIDVASGMKSIREELSKINKEFHDFNFSLGSTTTSVEYLDDIHETSSLLPEDPVIGRNAEKEEIIKKLSRGRKNDETVIVAVHGLGGMGKSTLAQLVYGDAQFKKHDHRIWVYVSRDFNLKKIGNSIISQLEGGQQNRDSLQVINQCLDNQLCGQKVLIVLDDLWEDKDSELGKLRTLLHVGRKGSMIDVIVTTRSEDIARKVSTGEPYKLQPLKDHTCWEIIKRTSKFELKHNQESLKQIGLDIAKKCGGVALAAQAVGYLLQSKHLSGWIEINNSNIWNEYSKDDRCVLPSLKLTYKRMPPDLRLCFSYCAIFKKGYNIVENDLIHQWIALNFIKPSMGKEYIRQLLGMSFLHVSKLPSTFGEHMMRYTMHDLVHDLATLIMADELITSDVASKSNYKQVDALAYSCRPLGKLKQLKYLLAPRLQNELLPEYITELAKLQYLNLNGSSGTSAIPESIGKLAGCLEFLCLSGCSGISKLPESFGDLKCLMYLDMSGCSGIKELPDSVGDLTNLQHLELSECSSLKEIPDSLCDLTHLQYLNLKRCRYIARLPEAIGCLVDLHYLNLSVCGVRELPESFKRISNLLHLDLGQSSIEKGLSGALHGLTALQYLDMSWHRGQLEKLEKDGLHDAMRNLSNLKVLDLSTCLEGYFDVKKNDGYLDFIGTLTNLERLDLSNNFILEYVPQSIGNLKRLDTLNLAACICLKSLPESIGGATGLKSVLLEGCSDELIEHVSSVLHHSLTLPLFKVRADDVNGHSNLHLLQSESDIDKLHIVSLENVGFLEEARRLELSAKQNIRNLQLSWTDDADRLIDDKDLLGELVPPMSVELFCLCSYNSPSFPSWLMVISHHHLPNLTRLILDGLPECRNLPPLGQLPCLERLDLRCLPSVTKIDSGICGGKGAFARLKEVRVFKMYGLEEWITTYTGVEEFMFPVLDTLEIILCPRLRLFKPCLPKCNSFLIRKSDQVISSLEEVETSSHYVCRSNDSTSSLCIDQSQLQSFRLFHHFPALQKLNFSDCPNLTRLPEGVQQLSSLQSLQLNRCESISALTEWLSDISSLKELIINSCTSIKSLPQCTQQLTNLQKVVIRGNQELQQWCESEENKAKLAHIKDIIYDHYLL